MASLLQQSNDPLSQTIPSPQLQAATQRLFPIYQQRLKSLIEVAKTYQQTLLKDNQQGALKFMCTEEMKKYRIERQFQLLKDALLIEKQKILIKLLTTYHQLKKDHQKLQKLFQQQQKIIQSKTTSNLPQKDTQSKVSASRVSQVSNSNEAKSNASVSLYQKMLQQKMILLKQMQKKCKVLRQENEQKSKQINRLEAQLKQSLARHDEQKQCKNCLINQQNIKNLTEMNEKLNKNNQQNLIKLSETVLKLKSAEGEIQSKTVKITGYETQIMNLKKELDAIKTKQQTSTITKPNKPSQQINLQTIRELKEKLFLQQQQLMTLTNSFEFLKQDLNESLLNEVKRLRISHQILQQNLKISINNMKTEMTIFVTEIVETFKIKYQNRKSHDQMMKTLRRMDNELDFFLQQKNIKN